MHYGRIVAKRVSNFVMAAFAVSILGVMLSGCSSESHDNNEMPAKIPVHAEKVEVRDIPLYLEPLGLLKASQEVEIRPQASGVLQEVHFQEGETVQKGSLLFSIDPQPYLIRLQECEAELLINKASRDIAVKKMNRYAGLANRELIPLQEWDELQSQVAKHEAQIFGIEAKVASARLDADRCSIKAPIDGKVGKLQIHPGNLIAAGQATPLTRMADTDTLVVEFSLTEKETGQLFEELSKHEGKVHVCPLGDESDPCTGSLSFIDHSFDPKTGLLLIQAKISNKNNRFFSGQHVQVKIPVGMTKQAMVIPQSTVKINQLGPYVFVIKEDLSVEIRPIVLGDEVGDQVVVNDGLLQDELVVTEGHLRLSPGLFVEVVAKQSVEPKAL